LALTQSQVLPGIIVLVVQDLHEPSALTQPQVLPWAKAAGARLAPDMPDTIAKIAAKTIFLMVVPPVHALKLGCRG
jgi:hypothetical protein